jgi:hypothetical protein
MIPDNIQEIANTIRESIVFKNNSQQSIMSYCLDKNYPLDERWKVWEEFSNKKEQNYIMRSEYFNSPLLKVIADKIIDNDITRGQLISYEWFLDYAYESNFYKSIEAQAFVRDYKLSLILEDAEIVEKDIMYNLGREEIMKDNFGSYRFDW